MKKQLFASSAFRFLENIIMVAISLLLTPYFIDTLGKADYGLWLLTLSILGWFNVIDLGFPAAVQRSITIALEKVDDKQVNTVFSTSIVLFGSLGLFSAGSLLIIANYPSLFGVEGDSMTPFTYALMILAIKVVWDFLMNAFNGFFAGMLRYDIDANISTLNSLVKALLVYLLIPQMNIFGAVLATLAADFISNVLKVYYAKKLYKPLKFSRELVSVAELKDLFNFSKHVITGGIARAINNNSAPILVTKLFELTLVPIYSIANRLATLTEGFASSITGIFQPIFTRMVTRNADMEKMFIDVTTINITVYSILYQLLLIFGGSFIILWVGEDFTESILLMNILAFSFLCRALSWSIKGVLLAQANHKFIALTNLFGALINIVSSIILSQYFGIMGIAIGCCIGFFVTDCILNMLLVKKYNDFNLLPIVKSFLVAVTITYLITRFGQHVIMEQVGNSWFMLVVYGLLIFPCVIVINWLLILNKDMKRKSLDIVLSKLPLLKPSR